MDRATLMRLGLPIVERLVTAYCAEQNSIAYDGAFDPDNSVKYEGAVTPVAILGPTLEELAEHAPGLLTIVERGFSPSTYHEVTGGLHRPIERPADVRPAVEAHWRWKKDGGVSWLNVIVLPLDLELRSCLPHKLRSIPGGPVQGTGAGLMLAALKLGAVSIVLGPDGRLASDEIRPFLAALADRAFPNAIEQRQRIAAATDDLLPEMRVALGLPAVASRGSTREPVIREHGFDSSWDDPLDWRMLLRSVWSLHSGQDMSDAERPTLLVVDDDDQRRAAHFRRLTPEGTERLRCDLAACRHLYRVAVGSEARDEDDHFVPAMEVGFSARWDVGWVDRKLAGHTGFAASRGYPLRPLGRICQSITLADPSDPPAEEAARSLWFANLWAERSPDATGKESVRLLCHSPTDADFLCRTLNDEWVRVNLRCRASGSLLDPRVSPKLLAETLVPWPDERQRRELLEGIARFERDIKELVHAADVVFAEATHADGHHDADTMSPWNLEAALEPLKAATCHLTELLGPSVTKASSAAAEFPPAPLALLRRRLRIEPAPHARRSLLLDLVDVTIRYDACLLLSLLAAADPGHAAAVFAKAIHKEKYKRPDLLFALGDWKALQEHARREAKKLLDVDRLPAELRAFARRCCEPAVDQVAAETQALVRLRNDLHGHGFTTTEPQARRDADEIERILSRLESLLPHLAERMLLHIVSSTRTRHAVTMRYRKLVHDNEVFEVESLSLPTPGAPTFHDDEIHLLVENRGVLLPLHPWLLYRSVPAGGPDVVWFLDGIRKDRGIYKSPQLPGDQKLDDEAVFDDVRDRVRA